MEQVKLVILLRQEQKSHALQSENSKAELYLSFKTGLNRYHGLLPIAEEAGIFKRVGHRYETTDGRKLYEKQIMAEADTFFTPSVLEQLNVQVKELFSMVKRRKNCSLKLSR